ncbi:MAG TPA: chemotaxis protein [Sulfurimonas sp. UBA12504]|nr:MAG: chemotaxis protein [Sulfurimonas sp. GWF2_37_8]DAB29181.1 MAG TPA: chemotaxis protein [Sulfurimonas sp. UBA12504]
MTQEELDALMSGDIDDMDMLEDELPEEDLESFSVEKEEESQVQDTKVCENTPPLPTDENKMVHQLDDVTKESEEKATQIFDIIDSISNELMEKEENANRVIEVLVSNVALFETLSTKFPDVQVFATQLEKNKQALQDANEGLETLQASGESIMSVMDIMQYQDIHRQKIERVINVMRALSKYMNTLFEGKIEDAKRVSSAKHIPGDSSSELASNDDIEALLEQFGQ